MSRREALRAAEQAEHFRRPRGLLALWFALLVGPVAWVIGLNAEYALVLIACARGTMLPLHLVSLGTLLMAFSGAAVGWREWRRAGVGVPSEEGGTIARSQFMAALGVIGSAYFALVILSQWAGSFILHPCMGI